MSNNQQVIKNLIQKVSKVSIKTLSVQNFKELQGVALAFIQEIEKIIKNDLSTFFLKENRNKLFEVAIQTQKLYQKMQKSQKITKKITKITSQFQSAITRFQGEELGFIYINDNTGNIIFQTDTNMQKFFNYFVTRGSGRGKVSMSQKREEILKSLKIAENENPFKDLENRLNKSSVKHREILQEAFSRHDREDMIYKIRQPNLKNSFYYWTQHYHHLYWSRPVKGHGYINEAYIGALIQGLFEDEKIKDIKAAELREVKLKVLSDQLDTTDNKGAAITQDLKITLNNRRIQVAVKSNDFSTEYTRQFIIMAFAILSLSPETTSEEFAEWINNQKIDFEQVAKNFLQSFLTGTESKTEALEKIKNQLQGRFKEIKITL